MKLAVRIIVFIIYTIIYFFFALMATGGGHGNFIFFIAPVSTWICPLIAICLTNHLHIKVVRFFFIILLLIHYLVVGIIVYDYAQSKYWQKDFVFLQRSPEGYFLILSIYLIGQAYIWSFLFRKNDSIKDLK